MTLVLDNLAYERNDKILFSQIKNNLSGGDCLEVRGANGSGKSTLLRVIAGLLDPLHGKIVWCDEDIRTNENYAEAIHFVGHQNGIKLSLTVAENLKLQSALSRMNVSHEKIQTILMRMGLLSCANRYASELSAGLLRRLSLAKLLLQEKPIWLLDEPTTSLDAEGQTLLLELINEHRQKNGIAIVATHHNLILNKETDVLWLGRA